MRRSGFPSMEFCPHCMQSRGPAAVRARAEELTDPAELALYGGGRWPHFDAYQRGELAANGNYYETDAISVRHGICGDPGQVRIFPEGVFNYRWFVPSFSVAYSNDSPILQISTEVPDVVTFFPVCSLVLTSWVEVSIA